MKLARLGKITKAGNLHSGRFEIWGAITSDGVWGMERLEERGTPWILTHVGTRITVSRHGSLRKCREAIACGWPAAELERRISAASKRSA